MRWSHLFVCCIVALSVACGASDKDNRRTAIGVMLPLQGGLGYASMDMENGVSAAVAYINSIGGLLGEQITYTLVDSGIPQTGFAQATAAAQELIEAQNVPAVIGYGMDPGLSNYITSHGTPVVMPFDSTPLPQGSDRIWPMTVNSKALGKAMALDLNTLGYAKVGYFHGTPSYAPSTPPFAPYLQSLNPNASWIDGAYTPPIDSSNWDARHVVAGVLASAPNAVLIMSDSLPESFALFRALRASDFPAAAIYGMNNQSFAQVLRHSGKNGVSFGDRSGGMVRQVLSGYSAVSFAASTDASNVYSAWPGAYASALNMYIAMDAVAWIALAITAANSWDPADVQAHMFDAVQGPLPDSKGNATATTITDGQLGRGFSLLRQGKPIWWQQSSWDPVQMTAPGVDIAGNVAIATQTTGVVSIYTPQKYNLPQFPD